MTNNRAVQILLHNVFQQHYSGTFTAVTPSQALLAKDLAWSICMKTSKEATQISCHSDEVPNIGILFLNVMHKQQISREFWGGGRHNLK